MSLPRPSFWLVLPTQALGVIGEAFGQRVSRVSHNRSNLRALIAVCLYSSLQAFVVLGLCEILFPKLTDGQGSLSMWKQIWLHPSILINAVNNIPYWIAQVYILREPLGILIIVMAYLCASFLIKPFSWIIGIESGKSASPVSVILGVLGALCCIVEFSTKFQHVPMFVRRMADQIRSKDDSPVEIEFHTIDSEQGTHVEGETTHVEDRELLQEDIAKEKNYDARNFVTTLWKATTSAQGCKLLGLSFAFSTVAITAGIAIAITVYFENIVGMNMFGYAAMDQVLLPFFTLPVVFVFNHYDTLYYWIEPPNSPRLTFLQSIKLTYKESSFFTLIMFRGCMFVREFLYFYVATKYNVNMAYLEMTLLRVVLSWVLSVVLALFFKRCIKPTGEELEKTFSLGNLSLKIVGTVLVTLSMLDMNEIL